MKIDRYSVSLGMLAVGAIMARYSDNYVFIGKVVLTIGLGYSAKLMFSKTRVIKNDYNGIVYTKGENDCTVTAHAPGSLPENFDGIKTKDRFIFKTSDGTDLHILKDGTIVTAGIGSTVVNRVGGSGQLCCSPDECWDELFKTTGS